MQDKLNFKINGVSFWVILVIPWLVGVIQIIRWILIGIKT